MRTDEHPPQFIAKARKLWDAGHSTSEIGRRLRVSKNAIVGVANRNDFAPRPSPIIRFDPEVAARRERVLAAWNANPRFAEESAAELGISTGVVAADLRLARRNGLAVVPAPAALRSERARRAAASRSIHLDISRRRNKKAVHP